MLQFHSVTEFGHRGIRRARLSRAETAIRGGRPRRLGADGPVSVRPERSAARLSSESPPNPPVARTSVRHRRSRPRCAGAAGVRLQHLADVRARRDADLASRLAWPSARCSAISAASSTSSASASSKSGRRCRFSTPSSSSARSSSRCTCRAGPAMLQPSFWLLVVILAVFEWVEHHVLHPRRVLPREGAETTSAPRSRPACRSRRSCSGTSCRTR